MAAEKVSVFDEKEGSIKERYDSPLSDSSDPSSLKSPWYCRFRPSFLSNYSIGLFSLSLVVFGWAATSYLIEYILKLYPKPFFMTYLGMCTFQFYFIPVFFAKCRRSLQKSNSSDFVNPEDKESKSSSDMDESIHSTKITASYINDAKLESNLSNVEKPRKKLPPMTNREMLRVAAFYFPIYVLAGYLTNTSFDLTDVLSATILLSTSCLFTLIIAVMFKLEKLTVMKALSVMISVIGVLIVWVVAMNNDPDIINKDNKDFIRGNIYAITSAFLYGVYAVMLKKISVDEDRLDMTFFFGLVGLLSMVSLWPVLLLLHISHIEQFLLPDMFILFLLVINYVFGTFLPNFFWSLALMYTSPVITAIGISFITPVSIVINVFYKGESFFNTRLLASLFMIISFLAVNFTELYPKFNYFFENWYRNWRLRKSKGPLRQSE